MGHGASLLGGGNLISTCDSPLWGEQFTHDFQKGKSVREKQHFRKVPRNQDVPYTVVDKWNEVLEQVVADPEFEEFLDNANMYNGYMGSDEFTELVRRQTEI